MQLLKNFLFCIKCEADADIASPVPSHAGQTDSTSSQAKALPDATTSVTTAGSVTPKLGSATATGTTAIASARQDKRKNRFMFDRATANSTTAAKQAKAVPK